MVEQLRGLAEQPDVILQRQAEGLLQRLDRDPGLLGEGRDIGVRPHLPDDLPAAQARQVRLPEGAIQVDHPGQRLEIDRKSTRPELQSLMRISYAVFCLKKKKTIHTHELTNHSQTRTLR